MALNWTAKAPGDTFRYTWNPPLAAGDTIASYTLSVIDGDATVADESLESNAVVAFIEGGTEGTTTLFALVATTADGETLTETIYLPIVSSEATGPTARDVCNFALRKVIGLGEEPDASQEADALENLNDMLRLWKGRGLDMGIAFPLTAGSVLSVRDEFLSAIKHCLRVMCHNFYGAEVTAMDAQFADSAYRSASNILVTFDDVSLSPTLANTFNHVSVLF